jgi:hypothetical protein
VTRCKALRTRTKKLISPEITADREFKNGRHEFYSFGVYGYGAHTDTPGISYPDTTGFENTRDLIYVNDPTTGPADRQASDADYRITKCGQKWIDWADRYNKRLCAILHDHGQLVCDISTRLTKPPY